MINGEIIKIDDTEQAGVLLTIRIHRPFMYLHKEPDETEDKYLERCLSLAVAINDFDSLRLGPIGLKQETSQLHAEDILWSSVQYYDNFKRY